MLTDYIGFGALIAVYVLLFWSMKVQSDREYEQEHRRDD